MKSRCNRLQYLTKAECKRSCCAKYECIIKKNGLSAIGFLASTIVSGLLLFLDLSMGEAIARVCDRID